MFTFLSLISLVFLLSKCSSDDSSNLSPEVTANIPEITTNIVDDSSDFKMLHKDFDFVSKNNLLIKGMKRVLKKQRDNGSKKSSSFSIFTDRVTYVSSSKKRTESYTFYIEREGVSNKYIAENLILSRHLDSTYYRVYLVKYFFKKGMFDDSQQFEMVGYEEIETPEIPSINKLCNNGREYVIEEIEHDCYSGAHSGEGEYYDCDRKGAGPYSTYIIRLIEDGNCGGGGAGPGPGPGGSGTSGPGGGGNGDGDGSVDTGISLPPPCQTEDCEEVILANEINDLLDSALSYDELLWLDENTTDAEAIKDFLESYPHSGDAKTFAKEATAAMTYNFSDTVYELPNIFDYKSRIRRMTKFLRLFGDPDDEIIAAYVESLLSEFDTMNIGEVHDIYKLVVDQQNNLIRKYFRAVTIPLAEAALPFIEYALVETSLGVAIPLLSRIPLELILINDRLTELILVFSKLGVQGNQVNVRIISTSSPVAKAQAFFTSLTKNAIEVVEVAPGVQRAAMGNGNFITFRTVSSSGFPATIDLNFPLMFDEIKVIKFSL